MKKLSKWVKSIFKKKDKVLLGYHEFTITRDKCNEGFGLRKSPKSITLYSVVRANNQNPNHTTPLKWVRNPENLGCITENEYKFLFSNDEKVNATATFYEGSKGVRKS